MFKFYVVRGYSLNELLNTTYAEKILLMDAMKDYLDAVNNIDPGIKG